MINQVTNERWVGACKRPPSQSRRLQPSTESDLRGKARLMLSLRANAATEGRLFSPVVSAVVDFPPGCSS